MGAAIPDHSWWQAELAVQSGGVGMRSATMTAPLAFLSSWAAARPMVEYLFTKMQHNGLGRAEDCMRQYDARTTACVNAHTPAWGRS